MTIAILSTFLANLSNYKEGEAEVMQEMLANTDISNTEKMQLGLARVGQGKFRKGVLARAKCCDVTGFNDSAFLLASHILLWAKCITGA